MYYIPQDIWNYIKLFTFDYKKYVKYKKKKLIEEFFSKTKFWTYKKTSIGYWYFREIDDFYSIQYTNYNSLKKIKDLCNYMNTYELLEENDNAYDICDENYKIPIFWTDESSGIHPFFLYNKKS
jgi:hypothetical protein